MIETEYRDPSLPPKKTWLRYKVPKHLQTGRTRVSPGEDSRLYQVQVGRALFQALKLAGLEKAREGLCWAACRHLGLSINTGPEKMAARIREVLGEPEPGVVRIQGLGV